ncbi:MAG: OmpA family protein [Ignavibacteriales bacterium]|nr:OmpA family protein [Ignavibacteriales bacterium]
MDRNATTKSSAGKISRLNSEENIFAEEGNDKDRYLITYADLITLLLGLFIILYTISNIDATKYKNVAAALGSVFGKENIVKVVNSGSSKIAEGPKDKLIDQLSKLISDYNYSKSIQLEESERGITVHILDDILFAPGQASINENSKIVLNRLAAVIKSIPNDIRIEGHTDNTPINTPKYPSNWHLSVDRALNTAYYLIQNEGIDPDKVSIVGYAEYRPIAPNDTPESRTKNRRVDLVILK